MSKVLLLSAIVALFVVAGCSSGDGPTQDTVKATQAEMSKQTPADAKPLTPEEASKGMKTMGPKGRS